MNPTTVCLLTLAFAPTPPEIHTDYAAAYHQARDRKLLLVDFESGFDLNRLSPGQLSDYVVCRVPADCEIEFDGETRPLLEFAAFRHLERQPGLAIIDLKHRGRPDVYKQTVSVLPRRHVTTDKVRALLDLPAGTLTQRTLVWALRVHPQRPRSVYGVPDPRLMAHCQRHCQVQCRRNDQHHAASNPGRSEIVAESWPWNKNIVDAAIDIVWSWSCSSGHWSAACRPWRAYGYDMQTNGQKWYATGVFD
ncbi:MAG TPA: hypothetical protein VML55_14350 [Planctomycetaceae bacterium]|nr:hypothetical protein [Planctomycetaceae bacterium]